MTHTIFIPHRNRPEHLNWCLASLAHCNSGQWEHGWEVIEASEASPFHKSKMLNDAIRESTADFISVLDVDCVVPPEYLRVIEEYFATEENRKRKLSHHVRMLPQTQSKLVVSGYAISAEKYRLHSETYRDIVIGNSQISLSRELFLNAGGYDEGYIGYGLEDVDFNLRCWHQGIVTEMSSATLYHLWHPTTEKGWVEEDLTRKNTERFTQTLKRIFL